MDNRIELKLCDIAAWGNPNEIDDKRRIAIPALQRGLVWKPKQIELLWDSLMRGIPIGSFVICKQIKDQKKVQNDNSVYHLLDGQQRANAIQLGFSSVTQENKKTASVLWIDLDPDANKLKDSSRNFLFRITTPAHPWGYTYSDSEGYLGAAEVRYWLEQKLNKFPKNENYQRPSPSDMQPIHSKVPVPLNLVLLSCKDADLCKNSLIEEIEKYPATYIWRDKALDTLKNPDFDLSKIAET